MKATLLILVLIMAAGCTPTIETPKGFARETDVPSTFEYRAISADDVAIAVRRRDNDPKGNLAFWTKVISEKLPYAKGYKLTEKKELKTRGGLKGTLMEFSAPGKDTEYTYLLYLIVHKDDIWLLEAGGRAKNVKEHKADIIKSFKSFKP